MSVKCIHPQTPLLYMYSKTGVCMGIPNFLIFDPKHKLWVLVRSASARVHAHIINILSKNIKVIKNFSLNFSSFSKVQKSLYIAKVSFRNL